MPSAHELRTLADLRRARDAIDRDYATPLDVATMARRAHMSPAHFSRRFRAAYGEAPHEYLMTRRVERAMALLRDGASVTEACLAVGYTSVGSFSHRFSTVTGETPSGYRARDHGQLVGLPSCVVRLLARPARTASSPTTSGRAGSEKPTAAGAS